MDGQLNRLSLALFHACEVNVACTLCYFRTAVNSQSGVRTPFGGVWTGGLILLALGVLTPMFKYIPSAALAGVIIMAVLDMVSFSLVKKLWHIKRKLSIFVYCPFYIKYNHKYQWCCERECKFTQQIIAKYSLFSSGKSK